MSRPTPYFALPCAALLAACLVSPAAAGPHLLPRIHLLPKINLTPKINLGKAANALTYPVKKSVINGGKTALNTAITIGTGQEIERFAPSSSGDVARKIIVWGIGRH